DNESYVYNGVKRYLSVEGLPSEAKAVYENNGQTEAGTYDVTATVKRAHFEDLTLQATLTIQKAESEIIAEPDQVHVYDGTEKMVLAHLNHDETELMYD